MPSVADSFSATMKLPVGHCLRSMQLGKSNVWAYRKEKPKPSQDLIEKEFNVGEIHLDGDGLVKRTWL